MVTVVEGEKKPMFNWKPKKIEAKAGEPTDVNRIKKIPCFLASNVQVRIPFSIKGQRGPPKIRLLKNGQPVDLDKMKDLVEVGVLIVSPYKQLYFCLGGD